MHRSSSMTFFYKYLFPTIWIGVFLVGIILSWNSTDPFVQQWTRQMLLIVCFVSVWLIIMSIRLKSAEATADHLVLKTGRVQKTVMYDDVQWITQYAFINPVMISIQYYDRTTGETKKALILPSMSDQLFKFNYFAELEMTKFIRAQIIARRPNYLQKEEPSRWSPALWMFITGVPVAIVVLGYFS